MRWVLYYLLAGLAWMLFNFYGFGEVSARVREHLAEEMRTLSPVMRVSRLFGIFLGGLAWPLWLLLVIAPRSMPRLRTLIMNKFRSTYLDRDGLLTPQMPAPRWMCTTHREEEVGDHDVPCSICGKPLAVVYCEKCVLAQSPTPLLVCTPCCRAGKGRSNVLVLERTPSGMPRLQDHARPCPWCARETIWSEKDASDQTIGLEHIQPPCEDWQKMKSAPDINAYMLEVAEQAKNTVVALHCEGCSFAVMAATRFKGVTADEEREFVKVHAGHKVTAVMFDGRMLPMALPEPVAMESKP